jgi:hypothetical protein
MEGNIKKILKRISLGEATSKDREFLMELPDDTFYSGLEILREDSFYEDINRNHEIRYSSLDDLIEESREEIRELESQYSEAISEPSNIGTVKIFARNKALAKKFLRKQRVN